MKEMKGLVENIRDLRNVEVKSLKNEIKALRSELESLSKESQTLVRIPEHQSQRLTYSSHKVSQSFNIIFGKMSLKRL